MQEKPNVAVHRSKLNMLVNRHRLFDSNVDHTSRWLWLIIVLEALLFWRISTQVAMSYPSAFDQTAYLTVSYRLFEAMRIGNFRPIVNFIVGSGAPNGVSFPIQGALLSLLLGAGRVSLLSLNFIYFAALQVVLFQTVRWKTGNSRLAFVAIALLLCQSTLPYMAGGIFDYRIDFAAYCTFGIWTCFVLRSDLFKNRRWSAAVGFTTAWLMSMRFITGAYFAPIMAVIFFFLIIRYGRSKSFFRKAAYRLRIYNFFIAAGIPALLVLPLLWFHRSAIYTYYFVGTVTGPEKYIRALEFGIKSTADALTFYPKSIMIQHLGGKFLLAISILFAATFLLTIIARSGGAKRLRPQLHNLVTVLTAILVPIGVLTAVISKSPIVGSIVCVPILLLAVLVCSAPLDAWPPRQRSDPAARSFLRSITQTLTMALLLIVATATFIIRLNGQPAFSYPKDDLRLFNEVEDFAASYAIDNNFLNPALAVDHVGEALNAGTMNVAAYERFGKITDFQQKLGAGIVRIDRDTALKQLEESDIIILTDFDLPNAWAYPANESMRNYWNDLWAWSNSHRILGKVFRLPCFKKVYVFVRPLAAISDTSGEWILSSGATIRTNAAFLRRAPIFMLEGNTEFGLLPRQPKAEAALLGDDQQVVEHLPVTLKSEGSRYRISIDGRSALRSSQDPVEVRLTFDTYFVPKLIGVNEDTRELTIRAPTSIKMLTADEAGVEQK